MSQSTRTAIPAVPPPWKLKASVIYSCPFYSTSKTVSTLSGDREFLYAPLELASSFSSGKFLGGLGMVQVIRYTESPVGPYDELLLVPGTFEYDRETGSTVERRKNLRITRIYVSQQDTCWNGRTNWNIPKHLATFKFTTLPNKAVSIAVYPQDNGISSPKAFFSATFKSLPYVPSIPMSTNISGYIGLDLNLVQPPLPEAKSENGELPGTDTWCKIMPFESSRKASLGWWDMKKAEAVETDALLTGEEDQDIGGREGYENWWPSSGKWTVGLMMENADIEFPEAEYWGGSRL